MTDIHKSFQVIIDEIVRLSSPATRAYDPPQFPRMLAVGAEGSIFISDLIETEILTVANWMLEQRPGAKRQHSLKEWRAATRRAFGPAIMQLDLDAPREVSGRKLKKLIEEAVEAVPLTIPFRYITMGCTLLDKPICAPLKIGPVVFEPKSTWLDRALQTGQISATTRSRLTRAFNGNYLQPRKDPHIDLYERSILDVLKHAQLACTVDIEGLASETAQNRAIIAARLGQTAIALLWLTPSRILDGFHLSVDHSYRQIRTVPFDPGKSIIGGVQLKGLPHGPQFIEDDWSNLLEISRSFLDLSGSLILCWTSTDFYNGASQLLRNLAQSIYFFGEACRDEDDLMSIVKFTAALEALAQRKSAGIIELATRRLGVKENDKVAGDRTLREVVDLIYSKCRSRTLHGTNPDILHDWSDARAIAESLARHCLVACMEWAERNPTATQAKDLRTRP